MLKKWNDLPDYMRPPEVKPYYDVLKKKKFSLLCKRFFDFCAKFLYFLWKEIMGN